MRGILTEVIPITLILANRIMNGASLSSTSWGYSNTQIKKASLKVTKKTIKRYKKGIKEVEKRWGMK